MSTHKGFIACVTDIEFHLGLGRQVRLQRKLGLYFTSSFALTVQKRDQLRGLHPGSLFSVGTN